MVQTTLTPKTETQPGLYEWQRKGIVAWIENNYRGIAESCTGSGKCHGKGTKILMYDCSTKPVENIQLGDQLMGPDSLPRTVTSIGSGQEELYEVSQKYGDPYIVNASHILSLKSTSTGRYHCQRGEIIDIPVKEYIPTSKTYKHMFKGFKAKLEFSTKEQLIPPYILGLWLGDGSTNVPMIHNPDKEILREIKRYADSIHCKSKNYSRGKKGKCPAIYISDGWKPNPFRMSLKKYGLLGNKHIPSEYLYGDRNQRLELLAGLLDTDGHSLRGCLEITQKSEQLANGIIFLARSLGFRATIRKKISTIKSISFSASYYRMFISGDTHLIPLKVKRKKCRVRKINKNPLVYGIAIKSIGIGTYYGFTLKEESHYLLADFTVTHNTVFSLNCYKAIPKGSSLHIVVPTAVLQRQWVGEVMRALQLTEADIGLLGDGQEQTDRLVCISIIDSLRTHDIQKDMVILDEAHRYCSPENFKAILKMKPTYFLAMTATLERDDGGHKELLKLAPIIAQVTQEKAIKEGYNAPYDVVNVGVTLAPQSQQKYDEGEAIIKRLFPAFEFNYNLVRKEMMSGNIMACQLFKAFSKRKELLNKSLEKIVKCVEIVQHHHQEEKIIIFNELIEVTTLMHKALIAAGIPCGVLQSSHKAKEREAILKKFEENEFKVLVCCKVLDEGLNVKDATMAIIVSGNSTKRQGIQRTGRVLRPMPDKKAKLFNIYVRDTQDAKWLAKRLAGLSGFSGMFTL